MTSLPASLVSHAKLVVTYHHMFPKSRTGRERVIVSAERGASFASNRNIEVAEQDMAEPDIGKGKGLPPL